MKKEKLQKIVSSYQPTSNKYLEFNIKVDNDMILLLCKGNLKTLFNNENDYNDIAYNKMLKWLKDIKKAVKDFKDLKEQISNIIDSDTWLSGVDIYLNDKEVDRYITNTYQIPIYFEY